MASRSVGGRIKRARLQAGFTQQQVADKIGKARVSIANYELGRAQAPGDVLGELAKVLNVSSDSLLGLNHSRRRS